MPTTTTFLLFPDTSAWTTKESLSQVLGVISIACWVVAQAPQFYENYVSQSCEGLALPFLVNWLAGDITNLIGCILTDQKEFQASPFSSRPPDLTWLAVYFCLIDFVLTGQYFYYTRPNDPVGGGHERGRDERVTEDQAQTGYEVDDGRHTGKGRTGTSSTLTRSYSHSASKAGRHGRSSYHQETTSEDQSLTEAALQVALAAERVDRSRSRRRRRSSTGESGKTVLAGSRLGSGLGLNLGGKEVGAAGKGRHVGDGRTSYHSEDGPISEDSEDNVWDSPPDQVRVHPSSSSLSNSPSVTFQTGGGQLSTDRGRTSRTGTNASTSPGLPRRSESRSASRLPGVASGSPSTTRSGRRGSSSGARRGPSQAAAGVVFMGVWVLAGVRWGSSSSNLPERRVSASSGVGRVIGGSSSASPWVTRENDMPIVDQPGEPHVISLSFDEPPPPSNDHDEPDHPDHRRWDKPAVQRLIGRMSAWICTTLYLTSRLPQIWKNYQRKSVEGLSILLFVFAFCGNLTYVLSIVLNPTGSDGESNPEMTGYYLLEALPYLLGSGGTLVFDLTIMVQSLVYGSAPPIDERDQEDYIEPLEPRHRHHHHHARSRSSRRRGKRVGVADEESRPLLDGGGGEQGNDR